MPVRHNDPGADLTQDEFINIGHQLTDQAAGDIIYATDATTLSRLPAPNNDSYFTMSSTGVPSYAQNIPAADVDGELGVDNIPIVTTAKISDIPGPIVVSTSDPGGDDWVPGTLWFKREA